MNRWLICIQTNHNSVKYLTNELTSPSYLSYYKFLDYVQDIKILDYGDFVHELDRFRTLLIDMDAHTWEVYTETEKQECTYEELLEYNQKLEEIGEKKKNRRGSRQHIENLKTFTKKKRDDIGSDFSYKVRGDT